MKKLVLYFVVFASLVSCHSFDKKVPSEKELLDQQIKEINWNEVDEYPSFNSCDSLTDETSRKQCFFEVMSYSIQEKLSINTLKTLFPSQDTINLKITVFPDSTLGFQPQFTNNTVVYDTIKVDSVLKSKLINFPKLKPAIKRGIPVKTEFVLPVIIKSKK